MKNVPNIISLCRILFVVLLLFTLNSPLYFGVFYLLAGLSDILDGYIARRTNTQSELGAKLDSFADTILFLTITGTIIYWMGEKIVPFLPLIGAIILLRLSSVVIGLVKYHTFVMLHTWGNKITGFLLFLLPIFLLYDRLWFGWLVGVAAVLSSAEECLIQLTSQKLNLNKKTIIK